MVIVGMDVGLDSGVVPWVTGTPFTIVVSYPIPRTKMSYVVVAVAAETGNKMNFPVESGTVARRTT
jgi:hypothetical protein